MRTNVGTIEDIQASAIKLVGLNDFGVDDYSEGLAVLLDSYQRDAALTEMGSKMNRYFLRNSLAARLLSESGFKQLPVSHRTEIVRPVFITGLPRSGTTALHRLLAADPAHQGLEMWLTDYPHPRPPRETWNADPIYQGVKNGLAQHHEHNPDFQGIHFMSADEVEECWQLLRQSVMSVSYESLAHVPQYSQWLQCQSWTPAYRRHKENLQLIGSLEPEKRWVLKNPSHLFALDALFEVYPDALVIQTHRDPAQIIGSVCSLAEQATAGWSTAFTGATLGADQLALWSRGLAEFSSARKKYPANQFIDVDFGELRAAPFAVLEKIYSALDTEISTAARQEMQLLDEDAQSGNRRPRHDYSLENYGLTFDQVNSVFRNATG